MPPCKPGLVLPHLTLVGLLQKPPRRACIGTRAQLAIRAQSPNVCSGDSLGSSTPTSPHTGKASQGPPHRMAAGSSQILLAVTLSGLQAPG